MHRMALVALLSMIGCGDDDRPPADGGMDARSIDAGAPDSGPPDAGAVCDPPCSGAAVACCPVGVGHECATVTATGECPLPDLSVLEDRALSTARVEWAYFPAGDCAIFEGCILEEGWRRLLRFDTVTPNTGTGDLRMGVPDDTNPVFVYSSCHDHYHFNGYADYRLLASDGSEVGAGHKQAFCLLDSEQYLTDDPTVRRSGLYSCDDQGIQRGWADNYNASLDCQWVDVTDVAAGDYTLRISINAARAIAELDYDNNIAEVAITVPADMPDPDPTTPCTGTETGPWRNCGYEVQASGVACTAGTDYFAGCGAGCALGGAGACVDDPVLRVCDGTEPCGGRASLANDDDSCGDYCPRARFTCPASGQVTVLTGSWDPSAGYTCNAAIAPAP